MTTMLKTILPAFFIVGVIIFSSCQKEIDPKILDKVTSNNPCSSELLVKIVSRTGKDSVIYTFEYDGAKRNTRQGNTSFSQQSTISSDRKIIRDPQGIIVQLVTKSDNTTD